MVDGWLMVKIGGLVDSFSALKRMVVAEGLESFRGTRRQNPFGELLLLCAAGFISRSGRTKVGPVVVSPW